MAPLNTAPPSLSSNKERALSEVLAEQKMAVSLGARSPSGAVPAGWGRELLRAILVETDAALPEEASEAPEGIREEPFSSGSKAVPPPALPVQRATPVVPAAAHPPLPVAMNLRAPIQVSTPLSLPLAPPRPQPTPGSVSLSGASPPSMAPFSLLPQAPAASMVIQTVQADDEEKSGEEVVSALQKQLQEQMLHGTEAEKRNAARLAHLVALAEKQGYGVKSRTHTVRRTRIQKTTVTTDMRNMQTSTAHEQSCKVEEWYDEGSKQQAGTGVFMARGHTVRAEYSNGSKEVTQSALKGGAAFWESGRSFHCPPTALCNFDYRYGSQPMNRSEMLEGGQKPLAIAC